MKKWSVVGCGAALAVIAGCRSGTSPVAEKVASDTPKDAAPASLPAPVPASRAAGEFDGDVLRAVSAFKSWPKLTRTPQHAPALCSFYPQYSTTTHYSQSGDDATHGEKVYHLYAMDSKAYLKLTGMFSWEPGKGDGAPLPGIEQVLIKDSFAPEIAGNWIEEARAENDAALAQIKAEKSGEAVPAVPESPRVDWSNSAYNGADRLKAGESMGQFVMVKYAGARAGTDDGWVYATVKPSGEIVQAGMIESCMGCHIKAPFGRMFGLGKDGR